MKKEEEKLDELTLILNSGDNETIIDNLLEYIHKKEDKIREKIKELRKREDEITKLDYTAEPEKAIDVILLRIGDLEELL